MVDLNEEQMLKEEKEFCDWMESITIGDKDGVLIAPTLVEDEDKGEDGE
jgi:hypothetical protein